MKVQKETKPDNTQHRYGWLDKHPFVVGFGLILIAGFISAGDSYVLVVIKAAVGWTGVFFIIRGIYFAIKKKVKK